MRTNTAKTIIILVVLVSLLASQTQPAQAGWSENLEKRFENIQKNWEKFITSIQRGLKPATITDYTKSYTVSPGQTFTRGFTAYSFKGSYFFSTYKHRIEIWRVDTNQQVFLREISTTPGVSRFLEVPLTAPAMAGTYNYYIKDYEWLSQDGGVTGKWTTSATTNYFTVIVIAEPTPTPTQTTPAPTATAAPTPTPTPQPTPDTKSGILNRPVESYNTFLAWFNSMYSRQPTDEEYKLWMQVQKGKMPAPPHSEPATTLLSLLQALLDWIKSKLGMATIIGTGAVSVGAGAQVFGINLATNEYPDTDYSDGTYTELWGTWFVVNPQPPQQITAKKGSWMQVAGTSYEDSAQVQFTKMGTYSLIAVIIKKPYSFNYDTSQWIKGTETIIAKDQAKIVVDIPAPATNPDVGKPPSTGLWSIVLSLISWIKSLFGIS